MKILSIRKYLMFPDESLRDVENVLAPDDAVLAVNFGLQLEAVVYKSDLADIQYCVQRSGIPMGVFNTMKRLGMQSQEFAAWVKVNKCVQDTARVVSHEVNFNH